MPSSDPVPIEEIASRIRLVRGHRMLLDADLAALYGTHTGRLNQQVKRNRGRFPPDFAFQLTPAEVANLISQSVISSWGGRRTPPWAFTEHGALAAAFVLDTPRAISVGETVVRTFVRLRQVAFSSAEVGERLAALEAKVGAPDADLRALYGALYGALQRLLEGPDAARTGRIGFQHVAPGDAPCPTRSPPRARRDP